MFKCYLKVIAIFTYQQKLTKSYKTVQYCSLIVLVIHSEMNEPSNQACRPDHSNHHRKCLAKTHPCFTHMYVQHKYTPLLMHKYLNKYDNGINASANYVHLPSFTIKWDKLKWKLIQKTFYENRAQGGSKSISMKINDTCPRCLYEKVVCLFEIMKSKNTKVTIAC